MTSDDQSVDQAMFYRFQRDEIIEGRYRVTGHLGKGGMGEVYLVHDKLGEEKEGKTRALKIAPVSPSTERFIQEIRIAQEAAHPGIVRIYDSGILENAFYYCTMEYLDGGSLEDYLEKNQGKGIGIYETIEVLKQVCGALNALHKNGIIHRDLKPANILITKNFPEDTTVKLSDFGVAKNLNLNEAITQHDGGMIGTLAYMAPEQAMPGEKLRAGEEIDPRVDIFALGMIAQELATGEHPYYKLIEQNKNALPVLMNDEPLYRTTANNKSVPKWLDELIKGCLEKNREDRYKTIEEVDHSLRKHRAGIRLRVKQKEFFSAMIAALIAIIAVYTSVVIPGYPNSGELGAEFEKALLGIFYKVRGDVTPPQDVVVISMDDESRQELILKRDGVELSPFQPWPRRYHAEILETIAPLKPKMALFDIRFSKPREPFADDERLIKAFQLLPTYIIRTAKYKKDPLHPGQIKTVRNDPHPYFATQAKGIYFANLAIEDGRVWRFKYDYGAEDPSPPIVKLIYGERADEMRTPLPTEYVYHYGRSETIKTYNMIEALQLASAGKLDLQDKYVVIGEATEMQSGSQVRDAFLTPAAPGYVTGEEIHATMLANVLHASWLKRLAGLYEVLIVFISALILSYVIIRKPRYGNIILPVSFFVWMVLAYYLFTQRLVIVGHIVLASLILLSLVIRIAFYYRKKILFSNT